jgi:hypothetical protein
MTFDYERISGYNLDHCYGYGVVEVFWGWGIVAGFVYCYEGDIIATSVKGCVGIVGKTGFPSPAPGNIGAVSSKSAKLNSINLICFLGSPAPPPSSQFPN